MSVISAIAEPALVPDLSMSAVNTDMTTHRDGITVSVPDEEKTLKGTGTHNEVSDFLKRFILVTTGNFQTTDTPLFDLLGSSYDVFGKYFTDTRVVQKLANYGYWRSGMEVVITLTAPANAYGLYLVQAIPDLRMSGTNTCNGPAADNIYTATQGVHAFIDVTTSNSVCIKLPFIENRLCNPLPYADETMWRLCLWCIAAIGNAVNSDTISATYNIYMKPTEDFEIMVPTFQSGKAGNGFAAKLKRGAATVQKLKDDKTISKTAGKIASAAAMASTIPFLAPFAGPVAAGAAAVAGFAASLGFTREAAPEKPSDVHLKSFSGLSQIDGTDGSEIVALMQSNTVTIDATIGGGSAEDEMSIGSFFQRWTIISLFTWDTSASAGTQIASFPVTPFFAANTLGAIYPTTAGFFGAPFRWWNGGMEYKLIIPSSVYHRGMLQVFWSPVPVTVGSTDPTQLLLNEIFDLEAGSEYVFSVEWGVNSICLLNNGFCISSAFANVQANGFLYFRVVSQLQATGGSAAVKCCLLARAKDNMRFWCPRTEGTFLTDTGSPDIFENLFVFQGKNIGDDDEQENVSFVLVPSMTTDSTDISMTCFGEDIGSIRALCQKFSLMTSFSQTLSANPPPICVPHAFPPPHTYSNNPYEALNGFGFTPPWTWYGHFAACFLGVRGSTRWKILSSSECLVQALPADWAGLPVDIVNTPLTGSNKFVGGMFSGMQKTGTGGAEFTLPYYQRTKWWSPCVYDYTSSSTNGNRAKQDLISVSNLSTTPAVLAFFMAGGPDLTLIRFRRVPPLITHP